MDATTAELIDTLKMEILLLERGGYQPSVHQPHTDPKIFRDSLTCLNVGLEEKKEPCSSCVLARFIPDELKSRPGDLCHLIPLNERGDTIASLRVAGDDQRMKDIVLAWLRRTVAQLEAET